MDGTGTGELAGRVVGITADRRGDEQALMFRRLGADVVHGPTIATVHADDAAADDGGIAAGLRAATASLLAHPPDVVVANTGLGMRRWLEAADDWGDGAALRAALGRARIVARGPKAAGALRIAGLPVSWRAPGEQLAEVVEHLLAAPGVAGARVALQLHGSPSPETAAALRAAGAEVVEVPVYRWTLPGDGAPAVALLDACIAGRLDAVTFTAGPQVRNLVALAEAEGRVGELLAALNRRGPSGRPLMVTGCIGPVCAAVAVEEGIEAPVVPPNWRLGALVRAVADAINAA